MKNFSNGEIATAATLPRDAVDWRKAKRINAHEHVASASGAWFVPPAGRLNRHHAAGMLAKADRLGIEILCISFPLLTNAPTPEAVRTANDLVLEAMEMSPRFLGLCYLNPGYARESLDEIQRCVVGRGMIGIKLYHQYLICDPALGPVMKRAAELQVPVLMHAAKLYNASDCAQEPRCSDASHFVKAAAMFPETLIIQAHIGGGGDWEWNLRILETRPNIYIDTSGSVVDAGIVDRTVAALGVDRVLFGTDMNWEAGVGKVLDARLNPADREKVFAGNMKAILARRAT